MQLQKKWVSLFFDSVNIHRDIILVMIHELM